MTPVADGRSEDRETVAERSVRVAVMAAEEITEISGLPLTAEFAAVGREEGVSVRHRRLG